MQEEILDEVEELATRMPAAELARTLEERAHALPPGAPGRAAWLSHAAERWQMAGDLSRARTCLEEAVRDGGGAYVDPRAVLVDVLLELGDTAIVAALVEDLRQEAAEGRLEGTVYDYLGETLELHGRLDEALRWFDSGLTAFGGAGGSVDVGCLNGRYRVRRQLGLPPDRYDALCEERQREYEADLLDDDRRLLGSPAEDRPASLTLLFWSRRDFDLVVGRWPQMSKEYGATHAQHRSVVERRLRALSQQGVAVSVGTGSLEEYVRFAEGRAGRAGDSSTRAAYAAHLGYLGRARPWPPAHDEPCWCGSGLAYVECCGTP